MSKHNYLPNFNYKFSILKESIDKLRSSNLVSTLFYSLYSSSGSFKIVDTLTPSMSEVSQPITVIAKIATTLPLFVTMMYFVAFLLLHTTQFESNSVKLRTGLHLSV